MKTNGASHQPHIEFHADDYGLFPAQSGRILDCYCHGRLNGISILPNARDLSACMDLLGPIPETMAVTVHLNLIEGTCLSDPADVPLLADGAGVLRCSFGSLLIRSYLPGRRELKNQLKRELAAQIRAVSAYLPKERPLRLDGHAHYHMLPVVFDAMMEVIQEERLNPAYIRIPREYLSVYLGHLEALEDLAPVNLVKVLILNLLAWRNRRKYGTYLDTLEQKLFLGVFLSGRMHRANVERVLPDALALAAKKGWDLEVLAHPGGVEEPEDIARLTKKEDVAFLTSPMRRREVSLFEK